jgi:hypothetical protein
MFERARVGDHKVFATLAGMVFLCVGGCAAERTGKSATGEPIPREISLIERDPCDPQNKRLYIDNQHSSRTFAVTVQWSAIGGKKRTEKMFVGPHQMFELGCASQAKILEATPTDF